MIKLNKKRGFEIVSKYRKADLKLPKRATIGSAGYDLSAAKDITIPSIWTLFKEKNESSKGDSLFPSVLVPTGIKAYMPENEYLLLVNRSSNPLKNNLALPNGVGIIDADYYNNPNNEGEIFVQLINYSSAEVLIAKGDRIAQAIFTPYFTVNDEEELFNKRLGGFGSTDLN